MLNAMRFVLLLSLAVWVGALIFFTFFAAPSIFKVLPRELAGEVVGDMFPKYWMIGYVAGLLSLSSLLGISFIEKGFPAARVILLTVMTGVTFYSGLVVAPKAHEMRIEARAAKETGEKEAPSIEKAFKRTHAISAALNMAVIVFGVIVIYLMSRSLRL
ncbi:MAG: DUF4149 domain-containing protein [Deltaproteobacteria bacterium]|nr:DUF4149 domain-containing protein [Deltaproteobacteria bacterium]